MSYTPIGWQTGDTITAEKLNQMDNGWGVESSSQTLFTETVTTEVDPEYPDDPAFGSFDYSTQITASTVVVTFDGVDYTCQRLDGDPGSYIYGGWSDDSFDFSTVPFCIISESADGGFNQIATETGGTHTVSAIASSQATETSEQFRAAVRSFVDTSMIPMLCVHHVTTAAMIEGAGNRLMYFYPYEGNASVRIIVGYNNGEFSFIPADSHVTASIVNGVFTVTIDG